MKLGRTEPRLWTPPLRELTPATSVGFDQIEFARDVVGEPFDPWQEWLTIHAGELLPDGRPRFRVVIVLVSRQNGKTHVPKILSLYWLYVDRWPMILGTSTKLDYAKESWRGAVKLAQRSPELAAEIPKRGGVRETNGEQELLIRYDAGGTILEECRYKIAASNEEGGRSLSIDRLVLDELRQHHDYSAWGAAVPAMTARPYAQAWALSNAGDARSVVLNDEREAALTFIETGIGDYRTGLFEWSCEPDADPLDLDALAMANPNLGRRIDPESLLGDAAKAVAKGGDKLTAFKTESMCIRVPKFRPAIDAGAWARGLEPGDLLAVRRRVALAVDVSPDQLHCTLYAAAVLDDDRVRVDFVEAWEGPKCTDMMRRALPGLLKRIKPRAFGWLPNGPAAAVGAELSSKKRPGWPPPGCTVEEIRGEVSAVCMGFDSAVGAGRVVHSGDPLLDAHVAAAERLGRGDTWVFARQRPGKKTTPDIDSDGHVDALYAAAAAAHLARGLPKRAPLSVITSD